MTVPRWFVEVSIKGRNKTINLGPDRSELKECEYMSDVMGFISNVDGRQYVRENLLASDEQFHEDLAKKYTELIPGTYILKSDDVESKPLTELYSPMKTIMMVRDRWMEARYKAVRALIRNYDELFLFYHDDNKMTNNVGLAKEEKGMLQVHRCLIPTINDIIFSCTITDGIYELSDERMILQSFLVTI